MWIDESDTTQLAQRLRVGPRELIESIGGPWQVSERIPEHEMEQTGTLFVGRAGPSVAILVSDEVDPAVRIGAAIGHWQGAWPLLWTLTEPTVSLVTPSRTAPSAEVDRFLVELREAVDAAAAAKAPTLVVCRYCGNLVAPEHAIDESTCHGCGSSVFGIVY
jgi:hypothetical protein